MNHSAIPRHTGKQVFVKGAVHSSARVIEAFRGEVNASTKKLVIAGESLVNREQLDISWLPAAAESYRVSADPKDYVIVDIPIVTVDIPNRNLQAFPYEEVSYFDPLFGRMIYSTFFGKPTHIDHENKDPLKAKGVHFDASMQYISAYNVWKIRVLAGFDRTKDPQLVNQILRKKRTGYSMGALVENFVCSVCGAVETNIKKCKCMLRGKGAVIQGKLVYQMCIGCNYIETSSVEDPADVTADTDSIWG